MRFRFLGKSGKPHDVVLSDRRVARIVAQCQDLPGQQLLQYLADDETVRGVDSRDVNDYIREVTRTSFTAKTFRTWGASAHTLGYLRRLGPAESERQANAQVREAVKATAGLVRTYGGKLAFTQFSASNGGYSVARSGYPYLQARADTYDAYPAWQVTVSRATAERATASLISVLRWRLISRAR